MTLNLSGIPFDEFTVYQREALHGDYTWTLNCRTLDEFEMAFCQSASIIERIIVDPERSDFNKEIKGLLKTWGILNCSVVTPWVEENIDLKTFDFIPYDYV